MAFIKSKLIRRLAGIQMIVFLIATFAALWILSLLDVSGIGLAFWMIVAGAVSLLGTAVLFGKSIFRRSREIQQEADHYSPVPLRSGFTSEGGDELDHLEARMKRMADAVREQIDEAQDEKGKMAAILANMTDGVMAVNEECRLLFSNPAAEKIFEVSKYEVGSKSLLEIAHNTEIDSLMRQAMREMKPVAHEISYGYRRGKILKVQAVGIDQEKSSVRGILVFTDVTEVRRLEGLRREFVANVSHELRTPLTSIRGFVETLLNGAYREPSQAETFLKMMEQDTSRLTRLIDDLLELSRLDSKKITLKLAPLDLDAEIKSALDLCQTMIQEKKIRVAVKPFASKLQVLADRDKLRQVFLNLLANAVKFNRQNGEIEISTETDNQKVYIKIKDTGCGIPEEAIPRIFERFFRVDKARARDLGGTGLGLSIVKHIVETHGGEVFCTSKLGVGSEFVFSLPVAGKAT